MCSLLGRLLIVGDRPVKNTSLLDGSGAMPPCRDFGALKKALEAEEAAKAKEAAAAN